MALQLELRSLAGRQSAFFQWPLPPMNDETDPTNEVIETMRLVCEEESRELPQLRPEVDLILRDYDTKSYQSMKQVCDRYNEVVEEILQKDIRWRQRLRCRPSVRLLRHIILQCYNRAVVDPDKLNQYEPFSAGVYGETSFELIDQMINTINFSEYDQFIDLGSGVGQVVLQVAAATNCKSCFGIEKANWPAQYAEQMAFEFRHWMDFYGKTHSNFELVKGDFLAESHRDTINASTVIFVNNFAFGPGVDHQLKERFHDLREGTKIVSSMEFRPFNMQISERNLSDIGAIMTVQELSPLRGPVSWTYKPVAYFLHTIDRTQLENYFKDRQEGHKSYGHHRRHRNHRTNQNHRNKHTKSEGDERQHNRGVEEKKRPSLRPRIPPHDERGIPQTPIRLVATLRVSENQDKEGNSKRGSRVVRSLGFGLEKGNGLCHPPSENTNGVLKERLERHIQKLKQSMGLLGESNRNEERFLTPSNCEREGNGGERGTCEGKRKRTGSGVPEPKRAKVTLLGDEEMSGEQFETQGAMAPGKVYGTHKSRDLTNVRRHQTTERKTLGNAEERGTRRCRVKLSNLAGVEQKGASSNEKRHQALKTSDADWQKVASKMSRDKLPEPAEILAKAGGDESSSHGGGALTVRLGPTTKGDEQLTPKSTNRWLFDIRLSSSPVTLVEGPSQSLNTDFPVSKSISRPAVKSEDVNSDKNLDDASSNDRVDLDPRSSRRRIRLVTQPIGKRIQIRSHPSHAGRGFATTRRKCVDRIESDDSCGEETPAEKEGKQSLEERGDGTEDEADEGRSMETKEEKKTVNGDLDDNCRLANSGPDESMQSPCWSDPEEFDDAELDEALDEFYNEAGRINETGYTDAQAFDMDWMRLDSEKLLSRAVPLPETEPISGSSDVTDPPAFFPPGNSDGVAAWLLSQGRHASDYDYKTIDWFPSFHNAPEETSSTLPPIFVSLPREALCPAPLSSIPISFPREAARAQFGLTSSTMTRLSPKAQTHTGSERDSKSPFDLKLDQTLKTEQDSESDLSRVSLQVARKSCRQESESSHESCHVGSEDAVVPLTSIKVSLPKEALTTRHGNITIQRGDHSDMATVTCRRRCCSSEDDRSCTSFSGSTLSYGNPFPVEGQSCSGEGQPCLGEGRPQTGEGQVDGDKFDEADVPAALLQLLDSFKSQYMGLLKRLKSPTQRLDLLSKIKDEQDRKATGLARIDELSEEILRLEAESVNLLRARSAEIGIEACSREQLFDNANHVVLQNRSLQLHAIHLHHQVAVEQEKLFQKYREFCFDETMVSLLLRNLPPVSTFPTDPPTPAYIPERNSSPSVVNPSSSSSPQSLDRALITSDLSPGIEALEPINIMPKLNRSVDLYQDDSTPIEDAEPSSRACSPELDMPLLMPELDPAPSMEPGDTNSTGCMGMSITVKLPLRRLLCHKKPPGLSVVIPTTQSLALPGNGDLGSSSPIARPASPQPDRTNMYSPISQASDAENPNERMQDAVRCFSPISSPGSTRSHRLGHLGRLLPPVSEATASYLQALPARYPTPDHSGWEPYPSGAKRLNDPYPWTSAQLLRATGQMRDTVDEEEQPVAKEHKKQRKRSSPRKPGGGHSNASKRTFADQDLGNPETFEAEGVFKEMTWGSCGEGLSGAGSRRRDGETGQMSLNERSFSVPLESRTGHLVSGEHYVTEELQGITTWQHDDTRHRSDYAVNTTRVIDDMTSSNKVANFDAVCRRLAQNSPRQLGLDPSRQLDSRSDSRDSGLGKETEADYDRGRSNAVSLLGGALDSGVSSPRVVGDRTLRLHPLTLVDPGSVYPWRPEFPSRTMGSMNPYERNTFAEERFAPNTFVGDAFQDRVQPTNRRARSAKSTGFNQPVGRRPSIGQQFDRREDDLSLTEFCGNENRGNFSQLDAGGQPAGASPAGHAMAPLHKPHHRSHRAPDRSPSNGLHLSNYDRFPTGESFDPKLLDRDYSSRALRIDPRHRLQTPGPAPNCQFEPDHSPVYPFLNHPMYGYAPNRVRFNAYPSHLFGGSPSFHSISNGTFAGDRLAGSDYRRARVSSDRFGYVEPTEEPLFQQQSRRCDTRLMSHLNPHGR